MVLMEEGDVEKYMGALQATVSQLLVLVFQMDKDVVLRGQI